MGFQHLSRVLAPEAEALATAHHLVENRAVGYHGTFTDDDANAPISTHFEQKRL